jgi:hypothetical protein
MKVSRFLCVFACLMPAASWAQQAPNTAKAPAAPKKAATSSPVPVPQGLTVDGVLTMVQAGLSEDVIIARLRKEGKAFDLSPDDLVRLKKANTSDNVLKVMMDPKAPMAAPAVAAAPAPVVVQTPVAALAAIPVINPSGATPSPGTNAAGDPNDPMTPHDSGIWISTKDRDGKPQMIVLERAAYQGAKTGGVFTSAMTYGIKKAKEKAVIPGSRASIRTQDASPVFYFYFDDKAAGLGKSYFGVGNLSNPNQFALIKLDVNKSNRETTIMEFGAFGSSSGTNTKSMIGFKSERIRTGLYKVTMNRPLEQGEYCFLASAGFGGAYGAGAAGAVDLFDFSISVE